MTTMKSLLEAANAIVLILVVVAVVSWNAPVAVVAFVRPTPSQTRNHKMSPLQLLFRRNLPSNSHASRRATTLIGGGSSGSCCFWTGTSTTTTTTTNHRVVPFTTTARLLSHQPFCRPTTRNSIHYRHQATFPSSSSSSTRLYSDRRTSSSSGPMSRAANDDDDDTPEAKATTTTTSSHASAFSKSRAPFRMPANSPDDVVMMTVNDDGDKKKTSSSSESSSSSSSSMEWNALGLWTELVQALNDDMGFVSGPTAVQKLVIPQLLSSSSSSSSSSQQQQQHHWTFLAATGSGKTLAYALPILQQIKQQEVFPSSYTESDTGSRQTQQRPKRPKALILAPTRELCHQISATIKTLCHKIKLSSTVVTGGGGGGSGGGGSSSGGGSGDYAVQRKNLNRPVDIVVGTPGRLTKHWQDQNVHFGSVQFIVLDEMDTMLEQGFARELQQLLYPLLYNDHSKIQKGQGSSSSKASIDPVRDLRPTAPSIIMTSATMTQTIQKIIGDYDKNAKPSDQINAKKHFVKKLVEEDDPKQQQQSSSPASLVLPHMKVIKAPGLHKAVPSLKQVFVDVGNTDKLSLLVDLLSNSLRKNNNDGDAKQKYQSNNNNKLTMVFCNTAASCRAAQYALAEAGIDSLSYHGELNSLARQENLRRFRQQGAPVATTIAAAKRAAAAVKNDHDDDDDDMDAPAAAAAARVLICTDLAARGLDIPQVDHVVMFDFPLNALDYLHRSGRTCRGSVVPSSSSSTSTTLGRNPGRVTALVSKRDKVLANAIQQAVERGEALDGLSSRKSDYLPGGRLNTDKNNGRATSGAGGGGRGAGGGSLLKGRRNTTNRGRGSAASGGVKRGVSGSSNDSRVGSKPGGVRRR